MKKNCLILILALVAGFWGLDSTAQTTAPAGGGDAAKYVMLNQGVPKEAERITVPLQATATGNSYSGQSTQVSSGEIPEDYKSLAESGKFTTYFDLGAPDGESRYFGLARNADAPKTLSRFNNNEVLYMAVFRVDTATSAAPEKLLEGSIGMGNQMEIPSRSRNHHLGKNQLPVGGAYQFSINGRSGSGFSGYVQRAYNVTLQGGSIAQGSKYNVTVNPLNDLKPNANQQILLKVEPLEPNVSPRSATLPMGDVIQLFSSKLVVEKVAADYSEIVLAAVQGSFGKIAEEQAARLSKMPSFLQVELFDRKPMSGEDVLAAAKGRATVMIFGELPAAASPNFSYQPAGSPNLQVDERTLISLLGRGAERAPQVVFVVRQIDLKALYDQYLGQRPDFLVLADFVDPLQTTFRTPANTMQGGIYYGAGSQARPSLRDSFGLPEGKISVVVFDASGRVVYLKPDVGGDIRTVINDIAGAAAASTTAAVAPQPEKTKHR